MAKLYTKEKLATTKMLPNKNTVSLILQYSKALKIVKYGTINFKVIAN
jgi:hypothetical protein